MFLPWKGGITRFITGKVSQNVMAKYLIYNHIKKYEKNCAWGL